MHKDFWEARKAWYDDCLQEFMERYGDTLYGGPRYHPFMDPPEDEEAWLIEFGDDGTAYPHGIGGIAIIKNAVTPWNKSPHYVE